MHGGLSSAPKGKQTHPLRRLITKSESALRTVVGSTVAIQPVEIGPEC